MNIQQHQQQPPHQHHHQQHMLRVSHLPPTPMSSSGSVTMPRVQWVRTPPFTGLATGAAPTANQAINAATGQQGPIMRAPFTGSMLYTSTPLTPTGGANVSTTPRGGLASGGHSGGKFAFPSNPATPNSVFSPFNSAMAYEPHTANSVGSGVDEKSGGVGQLEYSPPMQYLQPPPSQQRPPYANFQQPLPPAFMQQRAAPNIYASMTHMSPTYRLANPGGAPTAAGNASASPPYQQAPPPRSPNTAPPVNPHDVPHVDDHADDSDEDDEDHDDEEEVDEEEEKQEDEDHNPHGNKKKSQSKANGKPKTGVRKGDKLGKNDSGPSAHDLKKQACTLCHHGKTSCDGQIPCSRCIRLGKADLCEERPRKEHYKKRQKREREEAQARREGRVLPPQSQTPGAEKKPSGPGAAAINAAAANASMNKAQMAAASALMGGNAHKKKDSLSAISAAAGTLPPGAKPERMNAVGIAAINAANASLSSMPPGAKLPGRLHGEELPHALPIPLLAPQPPAGVVNVVSPSPLAVDMPSPMNHPLSITSLPPSVSTTPLRAGMPYLIRSDSGLSLKLPGDPSYTPGVAVGMPPPPGSSPPTVGLTGMTPTQMPLQPLPIASPSGTSMLGNRVTHMLHTDRSPRMPTVAGPGGIMYGAVDPSSMPPPAASNTVQTPNLLPNSMFLSPGFSPRRVGVGVGNSPYYAAYVDPTTASVADGRAQPMANYFPGGRSPLQMGMNPNADGMGYSMPYRPSQQQQQQEEAMFQQLLAQDNAAAEAKGQQRLAVPNTPGSITSNDMTSNTPNPTNATPAPPNAPGATGSPLTRPNAVASLINAALTSAHPPRNVVPVTIVSGAGSPGTKGLPPPMLPSMNSSPRVVGLGSPGMVGASVSNGNTLPNAANPVVIPAATSISITGAKPMLAPTTSVSLLPGGPKTNGVVESSAADKDHADMEVSTEDALRAASAVKVEQRLTTQSNRAVVPSSALSKQLVQENSLSCAYAVGSISTLPIGGGAITTLDTHMWSQVVLQYFRSSSIMSKLRLQLQRHQISQKRVQTYFAFLSEMLSEDEFKEVTGEMPMPIFCSTRASFAHQTFSPVFGAKYNQPRIEASGDSDATSLTTPNAKDSATLLPYHFNWQESPLTSVNDDPLPYSMSKGSSSKDTAGRGSVLATLQLRCRAGRPPVAHAGVAVAKFKSFKRRLTKRVEKREKAKFKAKEKKEKEKRKKRESESRSRKKPRLAGPDAKAEPIGEGGAAALKSETDANGATTDSSMKDVNDASAVVVTDEVSDASSDDSSSDSSDKESDDSSISTSSESDYSDYSRPSYGGDRSDSDIDDLNDLCTSGLVQHTSFAPFGGIPSAKDPGGEVGSNPSNHDTVRKLHENSCKFFKRYNSHPPSSTNHQSSSSSHHSKKKKSNKRRRHDKDKEIKDHPSSAAEHQQASTPSTSSTSTSIPVGIGTVNMHEDDSTCNCPRVIERLMTVHVNREWERLFGYTQSDLRMIIMKEGIRRALSRLSVMEAAQTAFIHSTEALLGGVADYREYTTIVSKWGTQIQCLNHSTAIHSEGDGDLEGYMITWSILPPGSTSRSHYGAVSAAAAAAAGVGPAAPPMSETTKTFFYS